MVIDGIRTGLIESAHDCAEGGLAVALAECCFDTEFGVTADVASVGNVPETFRVNETLFGESASRVVVSTAPAALPALLNAARTARVTAAEIGQVGGDRIRLAIDGQAMIDIARGEAETLWSTAIERRMTDPGKQETKHFR